MKIRRGFENALSGFLTWFFRHKVMRFTKSALLLQLFVPLRVSFSMQKVKNDSMGGRGITFIPSSGTYTNVVIWMHGLGDTADGWASLMPQLGLTDTKFILPTAPNRPISINGGSPMPGEVDSRFNSQTL